MKSLTYSTARAELAATMDEVCEDRKPILITRSGKRAVVMLSLEEFEALEETAHLLRSPENARRLFESIAEVGSGGGRERALDLCRSVSC